VREWCSSQRNGITSLWGIIETAELCEETDNIKET
jgi:hypothetical protein